MNNVENEIGDTDNVDNKTKFILTVQLLLLENWTLLQNSNLADLLNLFLEVGMVHQDSHEDIAELLLVYLYKVGEVC